MSHYSYSPDGTFIIQNYNKTVPFASFLPGISGRNGIPLWSFYVNRGQGIASFGVGGKHNPILEFYPADQSFQNVSILGFRTFIKTEKGIYEPFSQASEHHHEMHISYETLELSEKNGELGIEIKVSYVTAVEKDFPALIRKVEIVNTSEKTQRVEFIDGLPRISPFGVDEFSLKNMSFTSQAWMEVNNIEQQVPFYKIKASMSDEQSVKAINSGNFYLCIDQDGHLLPIVDPQLVFGSDLSFQEPTEFISSSIAEIVERKQVTFNRTPSALFGKSVEIEPDHSYTLHALVGQVHNIDYLNRNVRLITPFELDSQFSQNTAIIAELRTGISLKTGSKEFDNYIRNSYLDNILRGGRPWVFSDGELKQIYYLYNRKHGDLERDYNQFYLAPEYWSQGNGNYRDINQNRRVDVLINPEIEEFNILTFMNLIQTDGYNPLVLTGSKFQYLGQVSDLNPHFGDHSESVFNIISKEFTPGTLLEYIRDYDITVATKTDIVLSEIILASKQYPQSTHGEGYWVDHFGYNIDLIHSFLQMYPERFHDLFFGQLEYTFHDSEVLVKPLYERISVVDNQAVILHSVVHDEDKLNTIQSRNFPQDQVRLEGEIYQTNLFEKLLSLTLIKFCTLDPESLGIEMEAGKPGWYDALNGLPGMMGSSATDTMVLKQYVDLMTNILPEAAPAITLAKELIALVNEISIILNSEKTSIWSDCILVREKYRNDTTYGFSGTGQVESRSLQTLMTQIQGRLNQSIDRMTELTNGGLPTYFFYKLENISDFIVDGDLKVSQEDYANFKFTRNNLPLFLEGFVKGLRHGGNSANYYKYVIDSELFDTKLRMFRVNASLSNQSPTIGRTRSFVPGWLENASIWIHMEYKFLLELLRCSLYEEFYSHLRDAFIPFLDPQVYGRSILENSSFIVSSVYPDERRHGKGYYARLTGATVEVLSIYMLMFLGPEPYLFEDGELILNLKPAIPSWLFDTNDKIEFLLHGKTTVIYHNPKREN
ncbi:MAG: cellobiose phosphorylase, partial [Candidatus Kariarchaeaceae archaeon]